MTEQTGQAIVTLLVVIIVLLLMSGQFVMPPWAPWVGGLIIAGWLILAIVRAIVAVLRPVVDDARAEGGSAILMTLAYVGIVLNILIFGGALVGAWASGKHFRDILDGIPFYWVPLVVFVLSYGAHYLLIDLKEWWQERRHRQ